MLYDFSARFTKYQPPRFKDRPVNAQTVKSYQTRISEPYGPLKILPPAESLLASLTNMFALLTEVFAPFTRNVCPPPCVCEKCLSPPSLLSVRNVCPPLSCVQEMFVPRGTNKLFVPLGQTNCLSLWDKQNLRD